MTYELTEGQRNVCAQAVQHFGRRRQILKVAQELRELADECHLAALGESNQQAFVDERADVAVMLHQLDALLLPTTLSACAVSERIAHKIERLEKRINEETEK